MKNVLIKISKSSLPKIEDTIWLYQMKEKIEND